MEVQDRMTNEEAIKIFKTELEVRSNGYYDHLQSGGKDDCEEEASLNALQLAIKALEMQIPKKPKDFYCPVCSHYFGDGEDRNYCPCCGQKSDWSDTDKDD